MIITKSSHYTCGGLRLADYIAFGIVTIIIIAVTTDSIIGADNIASAVSVAVGVMGKCFVAKHRTEEIRDTPRFSK